MRLVQVTIEGFRSIRDRLVIPVDGRVTIVIGANEHGKSNMLRAFEALNDDRVFEADDLNWDLHTRTDLPLIEAAFEVMDDDREAILEAEQRGAGEEDEPEDSEAETAAPEATSAESPPHIPDRVIVQRGGVGQARMMITNDHVSESVRSRLLGFLPRVEAINPLDTLPDRVSLASLEKSDFMKGILFYAGIAENEWSGLFTQDNRTESRLAQASELLTDVLRRNWRQGEDLNYVLTHDSLTSEIKLSIVDAAVTSTRVPISSRSTGYNHFFALKTILYARAAQAAANSYLWLFDEPGCHLHPEAQYDLMQALEAIGVENQVVYSTHSVFLLNKNYPSRHRLLLKDKDGTRLDHKPYQSNWRPVIDALGIGVSGTILFARHIVLSEGDTEPIVLPVVMQKLVERQELHGDLNALSVMSGGNAQNSEVLIRYLSDSELSPRIVVLLDGDKGGTDRRNYLRRIVEESPTVEFVNLPAGVAFEDTLPLFRTLYIDGAASFANDVIGLHGQPPVHGLSATLRAQYDAQFPDPLQTRGAGDWLLKAIEGLVGEKISKVGIARSYAAALLDTPGDVIDPEELRRARNLASRLEKALELPSREAEATSVLAES